jgi:hypothetical protein
MPLIYGEGERNAFRRLREEINKSLRYYQHDEPLVNSMARSTSPDRPGKPHTTPWIVPFERNPRFTGRESQLAQLKGMLFARDNTTKIAITGLGGVRKNAASARTALPNKTDAPKLLDHLDTCNQHGET